MLIVEDHSQIALSIKKGLTEEGFDVDWASNLEEAYHLSSEYEYAVIILDLMLPDGLGFSFVKDLRQKNDSTPTLILTAKDSLVDKLEGFKSGTDDYLTKPFAFEELLFRIRALVRRKYKLANNVIEKGILNLNFEARIAKVGENILNLTSKEFSILELLLLKQGSILSRNKIISHLYSDEADQESNVVDVFINKLRRKIEAYGINDLIETVRGEGYIIR